MRIAIPKETHPGENRVPMIPDVAKKLCRMGADVVIESGMGLGSGFQDEEYRDAGCEVSTDRAGLLGSADMVLRIRKPELNEVSQLKRGCIHVSYLDPFNEHELVRAFQSAACGAISPAANSRARFRASRWASVRWPVTRQVSPGDIRMSNHRISD